MKKTHCILIATIVILFETCSVVVATPIFAKVTYPDLPLENPVDIQHVRTHDTRFLRSGEGIDGVKTSHKDSDEEERAAEKLANIVKLWTKKTTALDKLKDGRKKLAGYNKLNNKLFTRIKESGETPQTLYTKFDISSKIRNVDEGALLKDGNFMLWRTFAEWWGKSATNKA
ncbi:RxLR effector protein [Phytophthora megakarya]|uniref:RxLR effector protein n=1 Tax=Phytophthora megakarya TaxID=4795 RepID=A0A225VCH5_9STRA|nr:RxLR effector protein [Phytophthora megakarya]